MVVPSRLVPFQGLLASVRPAMARRAIGIERCIGTAVGARRTMSIPFTSPSRTLAGLRSQTGCRPTGKRVGAARGYKTVQEAKTRYHLGVRIPLLLLSLLQFRLLSLWLRHVEYWLHSDKTKDMILTTRVAFLLEGWPSIPDDGRRPYILFPVRERTHAAEAGRGGYKGCRKTKNRWPV
jgi:hypothetical protein